MTIKSKKAQICRNTVIFGLLSALGYLGWEFRLEKLDGTLGGVERLIAEIGTTWGRSQIIPADFDSWSIGAYSYPILYWMTRVGGAMNFCDGVQLKTGLLGKGSKLQVHHIFPKAVLYKAKYMRPQVNAIGNFCFLTAACNQWISATAPVEPSTRNKGIEDPDLRRIRSEGYFPWVQEKYPGVLESQWIPMDEELWKVENYPDFLDARRQLLASAANKYLADLNPGHIESENVPPIQPDVSPSAKFESHISSADEEDALKKLQDWMASHGAPIGEFGYGLMEESYWYEDPLYLSLNISYYAPVSFVRMTGHHGLFLFWQG